MTSISVSTSNQLDAIYSMMEDGQHSVKMERHSLLIWGITAAILILITDLLFNLNTIPVRWQLILSQTTFISIVLFIAGFWDLKLTRKVRQQRDESLSFIQLQLTKVWWFFIALIVLLNVGMNFFGGGYMFYGLTIALMGMAFYIHGLFSTQMLKWIGLMLIIIGLGSVALNLHFLVTKWLAAGVFGLGLPVLAFILDKPKTHSILLKRLALSVVWVVIVVFPAVIVYQQKLNFNAEGLTTRSIAEYKALTKEQAAQKQVIHLDAGTEIPLAVNVSGDIFEISQMGNTTVKLKNDFDVVVDNGKANGYFRVPGSHWRNRRSGLLLRVFKMEPAIEQKKGATVNLRIKMLLD